MGLSAWKKHAFPRSYLEYFTVDVYSHLTGKDVEEFILSRMNMRWWFSAASHLANNHVKRSVIVSGPRDLAAKYALIPG
jgi:hypothetical protein